MTDIIKVRKKQNNVLERLMKRTTYTQNTYTNSIMLLMDVSGSMSGKKIENAKEALMHFLVNVNLPQNEVGLVAFGGEIKTCELSRSNILLKKKITDFTTYGWTPMMSAIKTAYKDFLKTKTNPVIVIATDGQPTDASEVEILKYATSIKNRIRIITIGIGEDINADFLKKLASSPEDSHFAGESFELPKIYKEVADILALPEDSGKNSPLLSIRE